MLWTKMRRCYLCRRVMTTFLLLSLPMLAMSIEASGFPGLGGLLRANYLWMNFCRNWLRADEQRRGRECLFPEVSRDKHIGEEGANMDSTTFKRYDSHLVINVVSSTQLAEPSALTKIGYEQALRLILTTARVVRDLEVLVSIYDRESPSYSASTCASCRTAYVVYYGAGMSSETANVDNLKFLRAVA